MGIDNMELFKNLQLRESQKRAQREIGYAIDAINEVYNEWKKLKRRRNAVNIVTTSINKISHIGPELVDHIHDTGKLKLATILMRCMDIPPWADIESKRVIYRRLYPLIDKLQGYSPNTGTGGNLRDIIMTRLGACISYNCGDPEKAKVFVAYEPSIKKSYIRFIFGDELPEHVCKMQTLSIPKDFDTLQEVLKINHRKACDKYLQATEDNANDNQQ